MTFPVDWRDETKIRAAFTAMTRAGFAPHFGNGIPIGPYQQMQCAALDTVETLAHAALGTFNTGNIAIEVRQSDTSLIARVKGCRQWVFVGWLGDVRRRIPR